jgi:diaminopropionate ammonia-lyase
MNHKPVLTKMNDELRLFVNPRVSGGIPVYPAGFSREAFDLAHSEISSWPGYAPTPLLDLRGLAKVNSLGQILYKDESYRFGLDSFKALGGAYALCRLLHEIVVKKTGTPVSSADLRSGRFQSITKEITVTTATEGNHGRSVAWGAGLFHCGCVVYVPHACTSYREAQIAKYGARTIRTEFGYDQTVRQCAEDARQNGWHAVSDTSWPGYEHIPTVVMQGYAVMAAEVIEQRGREKRPTHVFVQAGVGGLAAAIVSGFRLRGENPHFIVVEPEGAAALFASAIAGTPTKAPGEIHSIMTGLECGEVSPLAWEVLKEDVGYFATIPDSKVAGCMRLLASSPYLDPAIVAGESAVAGLVALQLALQNPEQREQLRLDSNSVALLIGSEGATDPLSYQALVTIPAD